MNDQSVPGATLGPIRCVTVPVTDLDAAARCYGQFLGFRTLARDAVPAELARLWSAPAVAQREQLIMAPAAADDFVFRFVATDHATHFAPFSTWGWNAAEIIVRDVDSLAEQLADSPFRVIGAPQNLSFSDDIRAMQVLGPGDELLYLTEFKKAVPGLDTPTARCEVDRVFIMILAGPSLPDLQRYFSDRFGAPDAPTMESRVKGMSAAFGKSPEQRYPIAALPLRDQSFIEIDQMPAEAGARPVADGELPGGIAMVSFSGPLGDAQAIVAPDGAPYTGASRVACMRGATGELIEIIAD